MWTSWGEKLKQSEVDFYNQMINFVSSKKSKAEPCTTNEINADLKTDMKNDTIPKENTEEDVIILWAKWVYNSYFKVKSLNPQPEHPISEVKVLKREQADTKSSNNLSSELQKKIESDKLLNWRTERNNLSASVGPDQSFPMIRNKKVNFGTQLNYILTPTPNINNLCIDSWNPADNTGAIKELMRKKIENMTNDEL